MTSFRYLIATSLSAIVLFSSCATLISGTKQKVRVTTNQPDAIVLIDDEMEVQNGETVKLKRKNDHRFEVDMDGYEKIDYNLETRTNPAVWLNTLVFPVTLVAGIVLALQTDYELVDPGFGDPYFDEVPAQPEMTIGIISASLSWLAPLVTYGVDAISGANRRFDKEVELDIYKVPKKFNPDDVIAIHVDQVTVKLDPGARIGGHYNKRGDSYADITWQNTVNVSFEDLVVQANNDMNDLGLNVAGLRNINENMVKEGRYSYLIEAEIKDLEYNIHNRSLTDRTTECTLTTTWRVLHPRSKNVEFFTTLTTTASAQTNGGATPVYRALRRSIYDLFRDEKFRTLMARNGSEPIIEEEPGEEGSTAGAQGGFSALAGVDLALFSSPREEKKSTSQIAADHKDAVVTILTSTGHGSGFLVSQDGYILTNFHVVDGFADLKVKFYNGFSFEPEVVIVDEELDVALLKVQGDGYPFLNLTTVQPDLGDDVMVIGTPAQEDLSQTITRGVISGVRLLEGRKLIQTDAGISPGNSGGPMLDMYGQVVGIVTSKIVGGGVEGIGFCIPSKEVISTLGIDYR